MLFLPIPFILLKLKYFYNSKILMMVPCGVNFVDNRSRIIREWCARLRDVINLPSQMLAYIRALIRSWLILGAQHLKLLYSWPCLVCAAMCMCSSVTESVNVYICTCKFNVLQLCLPSCAVIWGNFDHKSALLSNGVNLITCIYFV